MRRRIAAMVLWFLGELVPKHPTKIVVHSQPDFEDGALAVLEELQQRGYNPIVLLEEAASAELTPCYTRRQLRTFPKNSIEGKYHFLTARVVITTHGVFRSHRPPRTQMVVNIWHGEVGKAVGRWDDDLPIQSTWSTVLSNIGKAFRCAEFDLAPSQVLVVGAPRNDRLLRTDTAAVRHAIGNRPGSPLILWLPTYRVGVWTGRVDGEPYADLVPLESSELRTLDQWLVERDAVLLTKAHPLTPAPDPGTYSRIWSIGKEWLTEQRITLYNLLAGVDCLITDVSSVWIDFLLTERPIVFAFPDLASYRRTRGIVLEPYEAWVPGRVVATGDELQEELDRVLSGRDEYVRARREAKVRLHRHLDDGSTARLLDALEL